MPQLLDPNFQRSVVLLVHHDADGTFGVVLNRETEITAPILCATLEIEWRGDQDEGIDWGGPVQPQTGWVLFEGATPSNSEASVKSLGEGICFAGSIDVLRSVAKQPPQNLRLLLGYAGWGPGQLESELAQGAWLLAPLERDVLFEVDPDAMWEYVVRSLGIEPATLAPTHGVH
jgi:putative transcriptional regulator